MAMRKHLASLMPNDPVGMASIVKTTYIDDNFNDTDATALVDHTPDTDIEGGGWAAIYGLGFTILSNNLDCNGATDQIITIDCGVADNIKVRLEGVTIGNYLGIIVRDLGTPNTLAAWLLQMHTGNNKVTIAELDGGWTEKASDAEVMSSGDTFDSIEMRVNGDVITAYVDDIERCSYESSKFNDQTYIGVYGYGEDGTWNIERIICQEI